MDRCPQNNSDSDTTNKDMCLKQLLFTNYKKEQVFTKRKLIQTLQIETGVYKTKLNQKLQIGIKVLKNNSDSDNTNRNNRQYKQEQVSTKTTLIQILRIKTGATETSLIQTL